ncbi:MAG: glycosyltransferase family 4 protein [Janthinobacterium lividum]
MTAVTDTYSGTDAPVRISLHSNDCAFFFGGLLDPTLPGRIASGEHPRVEYLELLSGYPMKLLSFQEASDSASPLVKLAQRAGGPYWGLAALGRKQRGLKAALTTGEDIGLPLALMQRLTGGSLPLFIITHGSYLGSRKGLLALRGLRGAAQVHFLCLSESLRQRLISVHQIPENRAHNIGYGVDTHFFRPDTQTPQTPRMIASAGMAKRDYTTLVAAVTGLDVETKIAADSAWFQSDLDIAGQTLPPNVEARSYGNYVGLRRLYAEAACVVVPLYDAVHACGYAVIAEAMAMGKPVITTEIAGRSDYLIHGETGFYVPPGDAEALRACIKQLVDDPELASALGRNARRLMEENYTLELSNGRVAAAMALSGK